MFTLYYFKKIKKYRIIEKFWSKIKMVIKKRKNNYWKKKREFLIIKKLWTKNRKIKLTVFLIMFLI